MDEQNKEMLLKVLYDLEIALKSKKDNKGNRIYNDEYIQEILKKLNNAFDNKKYKLVKKK